MTELYAYTTDSLRSLPCIQSPYKLQLLCNTRFVLMNNFRWCIRCGVEGGKCALRFWDIHIFPFYLFILSFIGLFIHILIYLLVYIFVCIYFSICGNDPFPPIRIRVPQHWSFRLQVSGSLLHAIITGSVHRCFQSNHGTGDFQK